MKKIVLGIVAHVDAGKTTLSEALLYTTGMTDRLGRVDKRDAYLDTHVIERERGITVFSKQASISYGDMDITLIDTPGHIDFSCEAERAMTVQDYAVLIISAPDGVTAHTKTLWHLLAARKIPTFIFINKNDISNRRREAILAELRTILSDGCIDFTVTDTPAFYEGAAGCDEALMAEYFETESLSESMLKEAIRNRKIFPCYFGSALKLEGIRELLSGIERYSVERSFNKTIFGAKVYKIARDKAGKRLTYMKITGGVLKNKDEIEFFMPDGRIVREKVEEIRVYSGDRFSSQREAGAGCVCAVLGPDKTYVGAGLGFENREEPSLSPVLDYKMTLPEGVSPYETYMRLLELSEEDPSLALAYEPRSHEIRVRLMGEIQLEILRRIILDRYGIAVSFDEGAILYKETVANTVIGKGHFEPLRHYAEVHLRIEPMPEGTGIVADTECDRDTLTLNWQRLVMTHIEERAHRGVLVGAPLTDVKITLVAGRAHLKHTEGGDFREATYRAIRQGLMKAESVLLEPCFRFRAELPREYLGRLMRDVTAMHGEAEPPEICEDTAVLEGICPVATIRSYQTELRAYTRGEGRLFFVSSMYLPAHNADEVIEKRGYDPTLDTRHTPSSVFCKGGSGYSVPWNEADALMHIDVKGEPSLVEDAEPVLKIPPKQTYRGTVEEDKELMRIFEATYGKIKQRKASERVENKADPERREKPKKSRKMGKDYVIIDGYNFIFANEELKRAADRDISYARDTVIRMMCSYAAYHKCLAKVVFDAYKRRGGEGSVEELGPVSVVYTKESETADSYIERTAHDLADEHTVRVVTSDLDEQMVVLGVGALRVSAREFYAELLSTHEAIREAIASRSG